MLLTTLDNVKSWLNIELSDATANEKLQRLIAAASDWLEAQMRRTFDPVEQTERFSGNGSRGYSPKRTPVIDVIEVIIGIGTTPVTLVKDVDYILVDDRVELLGDVNRFDTFLPGKFFNHGRFNCSVKYTAGYVTVPPAVEQACITLVAESFRGKDRIGLMSRTLGSGETTTFRPDQIPLTVQQTIDLYRAAVVP
jgi:hypothetical protein